MSDNNRGEKRDSPDTNAMMNCEIPGGENHADSSIKPVLSQETSQTDENTKEIQPYGMVINVPLALDHGTRETNVHNLNQLLADTMTLRDLYKKHHWQVTGPTFNQLHHLFDKHFQEQSELIDLLAERVQTLGGVTLAMAHDVAEATTIPRAPRGREGVAAQLYRLVYAHEIILKMSRTMAQHSTKNGDEGTSDILVSDVIRTNELQVWFLAQHLVQPDVSAKTDTSGFKQPGESRIHPEELKGWANESQNGKFKEEQNMPKRKSCKILAYFIATTLATMQSTMGASAPVAAPLYQVTVVQTPAKAINYRNLKGSVEIDFKGTVLKPDAKGGAEVRNKAGVTEIRSHFENLASATQFGSEYLTYVFWAISPDGRATNLGELIVKDGRSHLDAKTPLQALSLLVTAEPYFAVSQPSNVVILENAIKPDNKAKIELIEATYELLPRGQYTKNIAATDLQPPVMDKKTPFNVYQARNAVKIAKAAGAETYAVEGFKNAERLLALSETKEGGKKGRAMTAREAVQAAEDSRSIAVKNQNEESLATERQQSTEQINSANSQAATATAGQAKADEARVQAEQAKGQSDTERAAALALATSATASSTDAQADAKAARASAEQAQGQADAANSRVQQVEGEKIVLRAQLLQQLNSILQTRDTARGLIVNMSDALFQTGSSELRPQVREKLAKVAGIVSSHSSLKLEVEGHTDSVGSDDYNQRLSEKRAQAARDYLVSQGVSADAIVSKGLGKTSPIASNDTPEGRRQNRRVEIIVSGEAIGKMAKAR